ncbi:nicotinate (nicotinamide) nucleotide adenylyltransferase [Bergeyella zoohelcum]|uniref:Probable nicotinate-nucleotide adenylyltransferase n=1 Tax=Bergeyella zoohelcum ATCC 43767 TaxID=883096 RepID=K1M700_9FLAO|nr:nicotinate (nicotinamide) nucleotide adenylyltransferase [Bergeyella zoohelcum]EKB58133.1 nicotinate (nicotinamide) nucleotide adenylyltransferase [Bergeyella zoohelcum ATCC 43767]MDY6025177.1 nicotinate (nicotinamide) nucleotide adenylyltransferase [Bergeyella zoohelcum]SUV49190.1 Nicotinate-nucleotide adenylyltransferase [Bergeyella zoohelcum]
MKQIGLFFGSFNPIHIGHIILANHILEFSNLDEIWFVVTPHNPFKEKKTLLNDQNRLYMVELALKNYPNMKASNIEFSLPQPSYTIDTLAYLKERHPSYTFSLIMGEDNLSGLQKWKNADVLIAHYPIYVYPRLTETTSAGKKLLELPTIQKIDAPIIELSATQIRNMIKENKNVRPMLPPEVFDYLDGSSFYK